MSESIGHNFKHKKQRLPAEMIFFNKERRGIPRRSSFLLVYISRRSPAQRVRREEEEQGSVRSFRRKAETEVSGLCDDEAGPVIVFGTLASVIYGVILMLFGLA